MSYEVICAESHMADKVAPILEPLGCQLRTVLLPELSETELCRELATASAALGGGEYYSAKVFNEAQNLKIVARHGVGVDHVDLEAAAEHGVWVTNTPGATNHSVAEFTIGLILSALRHIQTMAADIKQGTFVRRQGEELGRLTIGVVGAGGIGKEVLRLARAFGAQALAFDIYPDEQFAEQHQVTYVSLDDLLQQADIVSLHCGLDDSTERMIGASQLKLMKPSALLINTARPQIIDKEALVACLEGNGIAGAAIDVWETAPEPVPVDDPLLRLDSVLATSWAAFNTLGAVETMCRVAAEEIARVFKGEKPLNAVNTPVL